jgi:hypothetical protein
METSAEFEAITPDIAHTWLGQNTHNRNIRGQTVDRFAEAMQRGEWQVNGDAIRFAKDGTLLDGQHRLAAIIKANVTITQLIVRGLDPMAQETMDVGGRRTLSDALRLRGERSTNELANALTWLWRYRERTLAYKIHPTFQQALALLQQEPGLRDSLIHGERLRRKLHFSHGLGGFLHYIFAEIDPADADFFFDRLITGAGLLEEDPIYVLRRRMEDDALSVQRMEQYRMAAFFIKAWNAYREGRQVKILIWRPGGRSPEPFPQPI